MERIVCLLIFLSFKLFAQDEFIFWAELSSKNFILFHQNQNLSLAMTQSENVEEQ
ncbi:flagellar assembly protein FlgQ, partial [Campylobacter jejuni]|nr:flagellar assembly protein FlgQ [Campylobacter jejuni]